MPATKAAPTPAAKFDAAVTEAREDVAVMIEKLNQAVDEFLKRGPRDGRIDYGVVGSLNHVSELIDQAYQHLTGESVTGEKVR